MLEEYGECSGLRVLERRDRIELVVKEKFIPFSILLLFYDKLLERFSIHLYQIDEVME